MISRKIQYVLLAAVLVLATATVGLAGGERANIRGISMARTFAASAQGVEAVGTNPANLVLSHRGSGVRYIRSIVDSSAVDSAGMVRYQEVTSASRTTPPGFTLALMPFGLSIGSDFINYDIYQEYFTGVDSAGTRVSRFLNEEDKHRILEVFPDGIAETHTDIDIRLFGMTIHNDWLGELAFTVTDRISTSFDLPKDYMKMAFFGLDSLGTLYNLEGTSFHGSYLRDYAVSYARKIPQVTFIDDFAAGVTFKVVQGFAVVSTDRYNATAGNEILPDGGYRIVGKFDTRILRAYSPDFDEDSTGEQDFTPFPKPAGKGFGFDLGISGEVLRGIRAGISITDIGSVSWTENTYETVGQASVEVTNPVSETERNKIEDAFQGEDQQTGSFSTSLPTALRVGAAFQVANLPFIGFLPGDMLITMDYEQGFNKAPGNTTRPRFALGSEWRLIPFLPLRTGLSFGGVDRFNWAAGFGLDFSGFALNMGTENLEVLFSPKAFKQFSFGMGMLMRF